MSQFEVTDTGMGSQPTRGRYEHAGARHPKATTTRRGHLDPPRPERRDTANAVTALTTRAATVMVNDSGRAAGLENPIRTFLEACRDSAFSLTVTDDAVRIPTTVTTPEALDPNPPASPCSMALTPEVVVAHAR